MVYEDGDSLVVSELCMIVRYVCASVGIGVNLGESVWFCVHLCGGVCICVHCCASVCICVHCCVFAHVCLRALSLSLDRQASQTFCNIS